MKKIATLFIVFLLITTGCLKNPFKKRVKLDLKGFKKATACNFGFLGSEQDYELLQKAGVRWDRPHPGPFIWNSIDEDGRGRNFDFSEADSYIDKAQEYGFVTLATIWPFNQKDQNRYYEDKPKAAGEVFKELPDKIYKPGNFKNYESFVKALVERYDGDGKNDYENLKYPIKYWEVSNEPSMQNKELTFFQGSAADYVDILKATYKAIKEADPNSFVLHAGAAGMAPDQKPFWDKIFSSKNIANYFDIANIHSIGSSNNFWVKEFKALLDSKGLKKEIWVTEANLSRIDKLKAPLPPSKDGSPAPPPEVEKTLSEKEYAKKLKKSFNDAFNNGANLIFYTALRANDVDPGTELIGSKGENTPSWKAYKKLIADRS